MRSPGKPFREELPVIKSSQIILTMVNSHTCDIRVLRHPVKRAGVVRPQ